MVSMTTYCVFNGNAFPRAINICKRGAIALIKRAVKSYNTVG